MFDGVVTEITDTFIIIKVEQYFKGAGLSEVKITQNKAQEASCTDRYVLEQRALFFTKGTMGEPLEAVYDGAFGSMRDMSVDNFSAITAATNCMATYEAGLLSVPCIAHKDSQKVYQVILAPISTTGNLSFSVSHAQQVTHTAMPMETFDNGEIGTALNNWEKGITGLGSSNWSLVQDSTAPSSPLVLKQSGEGDFPWCVKKNSSLLMALLA